MPALSLFRRVLTWIQARGAHSLLLLLQCHERAVLLDRDGSEHRSKTLGVLPGDGVAGQGARVTLGPASSPALSFYRGLPVSYVTGERTSAVLVVRQPTSGPVRMPAFLFVIRKKFWS